ncbi:MAG TPA: hypothetical protein VLG09_02385 [Candidatus Saccharimonadales bacterium]|nr:hypothetical protein [Candidatus Saccharimonadales bacterium]
MANPQTAQDLFNKSRTDWLDGARHVARKLLRQRHKITIEDVLAIYPRPKYLHRNTTGHVFRTEMFHAVGYTLARKPSSHHRVIRWWTLSDMYADEYEKDCDG